MGAQIIPLLGVISDRKYEPNAFWSDNKKLNKEIEAIT
jgi:hypothetical protein